MLTRRQLVLSAICVFALLGGGAASAQTLSARREAAPFAASVSAGGARFAAPAGASSLRVEVYAASGELVFDSGAVAAEAAWDGRDLRGNPAADGSYRVRLSAQYAAGGEAVAEGSVSVAGGRAAGVELAPQTLAGAAAAPDAPQPMAAGAGTAGRLARWADGAGTLTDASSAESNGMTFFGRNSSSQVAPLFTGSDAFHVVEIGAPGTKSPLTLAGGSAVMEMWRDLGGGTGAPAAAVSYGMAKPGTAATDDLVLSTYKAGAGWNERMRVMNTGNVGIGTAAPSAKLEVVGGIKVSGAGNGITFPDGSVMTSAASGGSGGSPSGTSVISAINAAGTTGTINDNRLAPTVARLGAANAWSATQVFSAGLSANNALVTNVGNPVNAGDAVNKAYTDANFVKFVPGAEQLSVGDANGTAPMINLRGGSTCCSGPGGHTPAWFKVFQNGSFVATGNLGIGVSPMQGKGYRTSWDSYKGAFRSGYADNEWDDVNVGFFSWAGGSNSTAIGLYALAFGDTNSAESTSSIVFGSGNQVKGAAGFAAGAGNRVCDTYGVAFGNNAKSGGPLINGKCDPDTFNIRGLAAVAIGYNVTADQDHTTAMGKFATNNGFTGTFIWSDGSAQQSADTFRNTANNEFAARATGGFRFRTNLGGTTGCNLPAGSGVFNCTSSRTTKENFFAVDGEDVLARLRKVPVSTWNYISEGRQSRHLGPMAEDFYTAFALGTSDKAIGVQDAVGVSLAAVKALDARTLELQQKTEEVEQLRAQVTTLEQRLAALEQLVRKQGEGRRK
ncbi:MAG TPA: FlgD immunoglobulin-like domain containing protein [Pyrinomonadaceae bacterium]|jgi:hypothetical protein